MYKRQTVYKYCDIITVIVFCAVCCTNHILIDNLQAVVVNVLFINQRDILGFTAVTLQNFDIILLNGACFLCDRLIRIGNAVLKKIIPFLIGELVIIQFFQSFTKVLNQVLLGMYRQISIALLAE